MKCPSSTTLAMREFGVYQYHSWGSVVRLTRRSWKKNTSAAKLARGKRWGASLCFFLFFACSSPLS